MKTLRTMTFDEKRELATLIQNWLEGYTGEVIKKAMSKIEDIINNDMTMMMLKELKEREDKEREEEKDSIYLTIERMSSDVCEPDIYLDSIHNHPLTHANSYRDILFDMYIR